MLFLHCGHKCPLQTEGGNDREKECRHEHERVGVVADLHEAWIVTQCIVLHDHEKDGNQENRAYDQAAFHE